MLHFFLELVQLGYQDTELTFPDQDSTSTGTIGTIGTCFEHQQHIVKFIGKKIIALLLSKMLIKHNYVQIKKF